MRTFYTCLLLCSLIISGCSKKEEPLFINLDTDTLSFESEGRSETLKVSSNGDWTVSGETEWCEVSPKIGKGNLTVTITVTENESIEERKATLTFKCGAEIAEVEITQSLPDWVLINGVKWATRNVGSPGIFVQNPEDFGEYYQWNKGIADFLLREDYFNSIYANANSWLTVNDPSPTGWRVPTLEEIQKLFDTEKVTNEWTTLNDITGRKFIDKATDKSIFLPSAGIRHLYGTLYNDGSYGYYWSSTGHERFDNNAYILYFYDGQAGWSWGNLSNKYLGQSIRSVVAE